MARRLVTPTRLSIIYLFARICLLSPCLLNPCCILTQKVSGALQTRRGVVAPSSGTGIQTPACPLVYAYLPNYASIRVAPPEILILLPRYALGGHNAVAKLVMPVRGLDRAAWLATARKLGRGLLMQSWPETGKNMHSRLQVMASTRNMTRWRDRRFRTAAFTHSAIHGPVTGCLGVGDPGWRREAGRA